LAVTFCGVASAGDGVVSINQAVAVAGSVTAGDAGGFPVSINAPGSYRLSGDLDLGAGATNAIEINADDVTLDLRGFSISGAGLASGSGVAMAGRTNVEIRGGTIEGFANSAIRDSSPTARAHRVIEVVVRDSGGDGIELVGAGHVIRDCEVSNSGSVGGPLGVGILVGAGSAVRRCSALSNARDGIRLAEGSLAVEVLASANGGVGVLLGEGGVVLRSTARDGGSDGIATGAYSVVRESASANNGSSAPAENAGIRAGRGSVLARNVANDNRQSGIRADAGSLVCGNGAASNDERGIEARSAGTLVLESTANDNDKYGLALGPGVGYGGNAATSNELLDVQDPGVQIGANLCGGDTVCP
jgi:hypothetical protein